MPWVRAVLRGQFVYARANERGEFALEGGRVEIRYKPNDGRKYAARADNLTVSAPGDVLPEETCGPADGVDKNAQKKEGSEASAPKKGSRTKAATNAPAPLPEGAVVVYADGACSGNPGPAGLGIVILDGGRRIEVSEYLGEGTNNIAELTAVLRAIEAVGEPGRPIVVHTDSQYTIGVVQKGWKAKANVALVASLRKALAEQGATRLVYVPGHAGVPLNERADELAREAVRSRRTRREDFAKSASESA